MDRYKLIEDSNSERLVNDVNRAIAEGWVPQGGVVVVLKSHDQKQLRYVQAMFLPARSAGNVRYVGRRFKPGCRCCNKKPAYRIA